eukprot:1072101-Amphidinium_carterae.1
MALGWEVLSACELKDQHGVYYDLRKRSPAFMKRLPRKQVGVASTRIDASFRARRKIHGRTSWWSPIDAARRNIKRSRERSAVFANLASGCCRTAETLCCRGLSPTASCEICGCDRGSYVHRLLHCNGLSKYRAMLDEDTRAYIMQLARDGKLEEHLWAPVWPDMISVYTEDAPVRCIGEPGRFKGRLYTDGSATMPLDAQSRRAGWAVVSIDPSGLSCQINYGAVPLTSSTLQTSRDAEDMAFAVVLGQADSSGTQDVHVDCQGTIARANSRLTGHFLAKDVRSHMWVNHSQRAHLRIHNVKAHQKITDRMTEEQRRDVNGNALADFYAKKGAMEHIRGGQYQIDCYQNMLGLHTKAMLFAADMQYRMWKDDVTDHRPIKGELTTSPTCAGSPRTARGRRRGGRKEITKWDPPEWLVALSRLAVDCRKTGVDLSERLDIVPECVPVLTHVLQNFDVWLHGVIHGSLTACVRCGAYATSTPRLLGKR